MATAYKNPPFAGQQTPSLHGVNYSVIKCNLATLAASFAGFIINDTLDLVKIPNYSVLVDFYLDFPAFDTSTGAVSALGDNVSTAAGGAGAGGFSTGMTLGRSSTGGTIRAGGTGFVHNAIPWIYGVPFASVPVESSTSSAGIWLQLKFTTAPTTATTTGIISGWVAFQKLTSTEATSGTGGVPAL